MKSIQHQGIALHVRDDGTRDGRVIMFANSLGTDLRIWDPLIEHLPAGLRLVRYDKRGHGLSACPPPPYGMGALVSDAEALLDLLNDLDKIDPDSLDEKRFVRYLDDPEMPDVDLLIRTGREWRISNFLLWQLAYSEIYFAQVLWPDFNRSEYIEILKDYQRRDRRFGNIKNT